MRRGQAAQPCFLPGLKLSSRSYRTAHMSVPFCLEDERAGCPNFRASWDGHNARHSAGRLPLPTGDFPPRTGGTDIPANRG